MGIHDRDYYRQGDSGEAMPPVCKYLIIVTVAVFLLQIFVTRPTTPGDLLALRERQREWLQERLPSEKKKPHAKKEATAPAAGREEPSAAKPEPRPADKKTTAEEEEKTSVGEGEWHEEFPAHVLLPSVSLVQEWFQLETNQVVYQGQIWRLLTCAFCHDRFGLWHILINMLFLYWFGRMLEPLYGSREFLLSYLTAAVIASVCHIALDLFTHHSVPRFRSAVPHFSR